MQKDQVIRVNVKPSLGVRIVRWLTCWGADINSDFKIEENQFEVLMLKQEIKEAWLKEQTPN